MRSTSFKFLNQSARLSFGASGLVRVWAAALAVLWLVSTAVQAAVTIPPYLQAPAGSVNTNAIGFKVKTYQTDVVEPGDGNADIYTEALLTGIAYDTANGNAPGPVPNLADTTTWTFGTDGYYVETNMISYERGGSQNAFGTGATIAGFGTAQFPGIPGTGGSYERFACEALTYLYLPAGTNIFSVNTDDDFKLTIGVRNNPYDAFRVEVGRFEGGRGTATTTRSAIVQQAGFYPVRCTFDQGTGGACWVWFSGNGGQNILINDRSNPNAILAYQMSPPGSGSFEAPFAVSVAPIPGTQTGEPNLVQIVMSDGSVALDTNSINLSIDGTVVTPTISASGTNTTITYVPSPIYAAGSTHNVAFAFKDKASPANSYTNTFAFTVVNYGTVLSSYAVPSGAVDTTKTGFNVKTVVTDLPETLPNNMVRAEQQVDGTLGAFFLNTNYANVAIPGPNPDGSYIETNWINYNIGGAQNGDFQAPNFPDVEFPGFPGNAVVHANGTDNAAAEVTAFLDLKAGLYKMIVNSDDGFRVTTGPGFKDAFRVTLGEFEGGRGASDTTFDFIVQSAGIYPFRLIWENGGGGSNLEWSFIDLATGQKILINNLTNVGPVLKAYYSGQSRAYVTSATPYVDFGGGSAEDIAPNAPIQVTIQDAATTVDPTKVTLQIDGSAVTPTATKSGGVTTVKYTPSPAFAQSSSHTATLGYTESDGTVRTASWSFNIQGPFTTGVFQHDLWFTGSGNESRGLVRKDTPNIHEYRTRFTSNDNNESGDNYNDNLFAYFVPDETTQYVIFTSSDDQSETFISPDRNVLNFVEVTSEPSWNNPQNWVNTDRRNTTNPENRTDLNNFLPGPITLTQGQKYLLFQVHSEGGGGDNVDLLIMKAADVTAPVGGGSGVPDNSFPPSSGSQFGLYHLFPPIIASEVPNPGANGENGTLQPAIDIKLVQGSFPLDTNSIKLFLNGANVTASSAITSITNPVGAEIKYAYPILPPGTNTIEIIAADKASPPNITTNQYTFITGTQVTLDTSMGVKPGSGDATQPGFRYRIVQTGTANENSEAQAEIELAGGEAANIASPFGAGPDGYLAWTNVVNFNIDSSSQGGADIGDFRGPTYPDFLFPGLPGTTGSTDNPAAEWLTWIEFPTAGYYAMGVNSDDGFRVSEATNQDYPVWLVTIKSPASIATNLLGIEAAFGPALPQLAAVGPITGNVVATDPADASAPLNNAAAVKGNIALIDRGNNTFADKISKAQAAGAIAVIVADQQTDPQRIITMGGSAGASVNLPAVEINYASGQILHAAIAGGSTVNASMQSHAFTNLGDFNAGRGASDTQFGFNVPAAGVYPMRLVWENGTGGCNVEWFSVDRYGKRTLINDSATPGSLKAFRAVANNPLPPPVTNPQLKVTLSGGTLTFTWSGSGFKVQSTTSLTGTVTWTDAGVTSSGGTLPTSGKTEFFRLSQ